MYFLLHLSEQANVCLSHVWASKVFNPAIFAHSSHKLDDYYSKTNRLNISTIAKELVLFFNNVIKVE